MTLSTIFDATQSTQQPTATPWQGLAEQLRGRWDGDWNIQGIDRSGEIAKALYDRGVTNWDDVTLGTGLERKWQEAQYGVYDTGFIGYADRTTPDGVALMFNGGQLGQINDLENLSAGWNPTLGMSHNSVGGNELGYSSRGKGGVRYQVVTGPDGKPTVIPEWMSSSDASTGRDILKGVAAVLGAAYMFPAGGAGAAGGSSALTPALMESGLGTAGYGFSSAPQLGALQVGAGAALPFAGASPAGASLIPSGGLESMLNSGTLWDGSTIGGGFTGMPNATPTGSLGGLFGGGSGGNMMGDLGKTLAKQGIGSLFGGGGGNGGNTNWGNVLSSLAQIYSGNRQQEGAMDLYRSLDNSFAPGSAYEQTLRQTLDRKDAAAGRRSQYGPREVELQARLAEQRGRNATTLAALMDKSNMGLDRMLQAGIYGGKESGLTDMFGGLLDKGIGAIFGDKTSSVPSLMSDDFFSDKWWDGLFGGGN